MIWGCPKIGGTPSHHPFLDGISHEINHPFGVPPFQETSILVSWPDSTPRLQASQDSFYREAIVVKHIELNILSINIYTCICIYSKHIVLSLSLYIYLYIHYHIGIMLDHTLSIWFRMKILLETQHMFALEVHPVFPAWHVVLFASRTHFLKYSLPWSTNNFYDPAKTTTWYSN